MSLETVRGLSTLLFNSLFYWLSFQESLPSWKMELRVGNKYRWIFFHIIHSLFQPPGSSWKPPKKWVLKFGRPPWVMRACSLVGSGCKLLGSPQAKSQECNPPHPHPPWYEYSSMLKLKLKQTVLAIFTCACSSPEYRVLQWLDRAAALSRPYQISISLAIASSTDRRHNLQFQYRYLMRIFEYFPEYLNICAEYLNIFFRIFEYVSRIF